jgi:hypothetical protein
VRSPLDAFAQESQEALLQSQLVLQERFPAESLGASLEVFPAVYLEVSPVASLLASLAAFLQAAFPAAFLAASLEASLVESLLAFLETSLAVSPVEPPSLLTSAFVLLVETSLVETSLEAFLMTSQ